MQEPEAASSLNDGMAFDSIHHLFWENASVLPSLNFFSKIVIFSILYFRKVLSLSVT